jgi:hypothetical protein
LDVEELAQEQEKKRSEEDVLGGERNSDMREWIRVAQKNTRQFGVV